MKKLYAKLRSALVEHDITQSDLARRLLVSQRTISARFCAEQPWTINEMYTTLDWLGLPHDQMHIYFPPDGVSAPAVNTKQ